MAARITVEEVLIASGIVSLQKHKVEAVVEVISGYQHDGKSLPLHACTSQPS